MERLARRVRLTAGDLADQVELPFERLYRPTRSGLGFTLPASDVSRRSAWALLGEWLVAAAVDAQCAGDGFESTHQWFWQGTDREIGTPPRVSPPVDIGPAHELRALMPYILDPMAAATRRDVQSAQSTPLERRARKASGIFYTPGDVAHMMVEKLARRRSEADSENWLDPAHGSGVFLRAAFCALGGDTDAAERLFGVDIEPIAAEIASFVLTAEDIFQNPCGPAPWRRWHRFRRNLATGDALLIDTSTSATQGFLQLDCTPNLMEGLPLGHVAPWRLSTVFPETGKSGFARIIGNPPYASLKRGAASIHIRNLHPLTGHSIGADISPAFVELATGLLPKDGAMALVLPLSVVASTRAPFPALRQHLTEQPGTLELLSFDRVPDALFGDDIKTRNSIIYLDKVAPADIKVSPLYRWTSRTRAAALSKIPTISVANIDGVPKSVPKIGTAWERELLFACSNTATSLEDLLSSRRLVSLGEDAVSARSDERCCVALAPTAYNFLGVIREPSLALRDGHNSQNGLHLMQLNSGHQASAAYAVLSSRLAFWTWHVTGDGFHVTAALMRRLPAPPKGSSANFRLAELGEELWREAQTQTSRSTNRGRTSVTYPTWACADLLDEIDSELERYIGMQFGARLAEWHEELVVVDVESERRAMTRRKNR